MKSKKSKIITIASIVLAVVVYITASHWVSLQKSMDIKVDRFYSLVDDLKEIIYVDKFADKESVAIALGKGRDGSPYIFVLWDGWSRYANILAYEPDNINYNIEAEMTKFGQPYFGIFPNPTEDTVMVNGLEHKVFKFNATIDGVEYYLGFYCGLKNITEDTNDNSVG